MAEAVTQAFRAPRIPDITISCDFPITSNSEPIDQRICAVHTALLGSENILECQQQWPVRTFTIWSSAAITTAENPFLTVFGELVASQESAIMPPLAIVSWPRYLIFHSIISLTSHQTQILHCVLEFMPSCLQHWHTYLLLVLLIISFRTRQIISDNRTKTSSLRSSLNL